MRMIVVLSRALCLLCLFITPVTARHALSAGARYHTRHMQYVELPYNKGDMSYMLGYEYHEAGGFWQLLIGFTPSVSDGTDGRGIGVESVITPQLNLLFEDRNWVAGVGVLSSYINRDNKAVIEDEELRDEWTDIYWQLMIGYRMVLPALQIELMLYYPFEKWNTLRNFKGEDLEYGLMLKRMF